VPSSTPTQQESSFSTYPNQYRIPQPDTSFQHYPRTTPQNQRQAGGPPAAVPSANRVPLQTPKLTSVGLRAVFGVPPVRSPSGQRFSDLDRLYKNKPQWRQRLRLASFKNQPFYVEQQGRSSGRRTVLHQYPKRDLPYAEDMGREALRYQITGYLIQAPNYNESNYYGNSTGNIMSSNYDDARDRLEAALMEKSPGRLLDPYNPRLILTGYGGQGPLLFMCERYTIIEARQKGGFCQLEMAFVEAGIPGSSNAPMINTVAKVAATSDAATAAAADQANQLQSLDQYVLDQMMRNRTDLPGRYEELLNR
jgi:hypothetical protein